MDWSDIAKTVGTSGVIVAAITYLAKSLWGHWLTSDLEKHRASLRLENETKIEQLKAELSRVALEHEVKFSRVHDRRAEVIADIYKRLYHVVRDFKSLTAMMEFSGEPSKEEKRKTAIASYNNLAPFFCENRIYLEEEVCKLMESFLRKIRDVNALWQKELRSQQRTEPPKEDYWMQAEEAMEKETPIIFSSLEQTFRSILGVPCELPTKDNIRKVD
jgi:hypothetical protein